MEPKKYLLFVTLPYAYSILRPLEHEIRRRGDSAAWFIEADCPVALEEGEVHLKTIREAVDYNPVAVFAPGQLHSGFLSGREGGAFPRLCHSETHRGGRRPFHRARLVRHLLHARSKQYALFQGAGAAIRVFPGLRDRLAQSRHLFFTRNAAQAPQRPARYSSIRRPLRAMYVLRPI